MTNPSPRYFTVEEANRTLPFVQRIVNDIVADYRQWKDAVHRYELLAGGQDVADDSAPGELHEEVERIAERIAGYIDELSTVGCLFKGFDEGLVDFYGLRDGREIFLCWKLGEPEVMHWHEISDGFAGRQPLTPQAVRKEFD